MPIIEPYILQTPVLLTTSPGDSQRYVLERIGKIRLMDADDQIVETPFLDISEQVGTEGEGGLVGLAFHPDFASNRRFFVHYTNTIGSVRISEFAQSAEDPTRADPTSEKILLVIPQPSTEHNGGGMAFGPDGLLYIGIGDGGGYGDPFENAQDPSTLMGVILRIDIDGEAPYEIPPENAFAEGAEASEVWAYGLRNPYRMYIDDALGSLIVGDVGQDRSEEIDLIPLDSAGLNFGWPITEGFSCFPGVGIEEDLVSDCDRTGLVDPVFEYLHGDLTTGNCAMIGGPVYRGSAMPELDGHIFYADLCSRLMGSFKYENGSVVDERDWVAEVGLLDDPILSFGLDNEGELYVVTGNQGVIFKLVKTPGG